MINKVSEYKQVDIEKIDSKSSFFHYTNINNLDSIIEKGLEPRIGENSLFIEKSKKVFFVVGTDGMLTIMDVWVKWLVLRPKSKFVYGCGAYLMTNPYFPKIIIDIIFKFWFNKKSQITKKCKELKMILEKSVFLVLDLQENIDFSYDDIDEVKAQSFSRKQLKYIYSYDSDVLDSKIEFWNMHTYSNKSIEPNKILLLKDGEDYMADLIIKNLIEKDLEYVKENYKFLYEYYNCVY